MGLIIGVLWLEKHEYEYGRKQKLRLWEHMCLFVKSSCLNNKDAHLLAIT
jgi:hypothetical protein